MDEKKFKKKAKITSREPARQQRTEQKKWTTYYFQEIISKGSRLQLAWQDEWFGVIRVFSPYLLR